MAAIKKTTFTPGPWFAVAAADGATYISDSTAIIGGRVIAALDNPDDEDESNANLIAAAPELYEALTDLVDNAYTYDPDGVRLCKFCSCVCDPDPFVQADHYLDCPVVPAEAALRKARGE